MYYSILATLVAALLPLLCGAKDNSNSNNNNNNNRDAKFMSFFNVIQFKADPCDGSSGEQGICQSEDICNQAGGNNIGSCASGRALGQRMKYTSYYGILVKSTDYVDTD